MSLAGEYHQIPAVFYCEWAGLEHGQELEAEQKEIIKSYYPACCFSHFFGLPTLKITEKDGNIHETPPIPYNGYQKRWIQRISTERFYAMKKCRGAGATEMLTIRWKLYRALINHIHNRKWIIVAGTKQQLAKEILARIKVLADRRPFVYKEKPQSEQPDELLIGVSKIMAFGANSEAVRGLENVEDIDLEEPASWDLTNDQPVLDAAEPHVTKSGATLQIKGTPRGKRGFFWNKIWTDAIRFASKYYKEETLVDEVLKAEYPLISKDEVERIRLTDPTLWRQEYNGEFVVPEASLYGELTEQNISSEFEPLTL